MAFVFPCPGGLRAGGRSHEDLRKRPPKPRVHRHSVQCRSDAAPSGPNRVVKYFAYFSNMNPLVLGPQSQVFGRRCNILDAQSASLRDFSLVFNVIGIPPEPVFANIAEKLGGEVKGVLYSLRTSDFDRVARSEGYIDTLRTRPFPFRQLLGARLLDIDVRLVNGDMMRATTVFWPTSVSPPAQLVKLLKPSRRYVQYAIDGARYHGIETWYIRKVLGNVETDRGILGGFGIRTATQPHILDSGGDVVSDMFSPFKKLTLRKETVLALKANGGFDGDDLRLVNLSSGLPVDGNELLYFIPGIDGTGRSILSHLQGLEDSGFKVQCLVYPQGNRQSLNELADEVARLISCDAGGRKVNIVAESMGASIALLLIARQGRRGRQNGNDVYQSTPKVNLGFMLLLNPATSFSRSSLAPLLMPILQAGVPDDVYRAILGPIILSLGVDMSTLQSQFSFEKLKKANDSLFSMEELANILPREVAQHRIRLLQSFTLVSSDIANIRKEIGGRIGMVCCENDRLLPSAAEGTRFKKKIPELKLAILPYGGHTILQDTRFNLAEHIRAMEHPSAKQMPSPSNAKPGKGNADSRLEKSREAIRKRLRKQFEDDDWRRSGHDMSQADMDELTEFIADYTKLMSPVFVGEERLPPSTCKRPVLFVSNHTLLPLFDGIFIVERILRKRKTLIRSMASRVVFTMRNLVSPGFRLIPMADALKFGFTNLNPRSFGASLAGGEYVLLFPGGAREALKRRGDAPYSLHWGKETEFVRFAALFNAIVVPVSTVGSEDMVRVLADGADIFPTLDFLLKTLTNKGFAETVDVAAGGGGKAWKGSGGDEDAKSLVALVGMPTGLDRLYFRFGHPIEVPADAYEDADVAADVYARVKSRVEDGVEVLLERREHDAYRSPAARARFAIANGTDVHPPAGPAWAFGDGEGGVLGEDLQPKI